MIRVGPRKIGIGWTGEIEDAEADPRYRDQHRALQFFQQFRADEDSMRKLRRLLAERIDGVSALRDDAMMTRLSWELCHGHLLMGGGQARTGGPSGAGGASAAAEPVFIPPPPPPPEPPPKSAPAARKETPPPPLDRPTLPENLHPAAMAKTLQSAAASGAPFCEICAKAAAQAAAAAAPDKAPASTPTPPPPPKPAAPPAAERPTLPPVNAAAMADTLKDAAAEGAPFCEVCAKAAAGGVN